MRLEGPDAALAEHHAAVPAVEDVLRRQEQLLPLATVPWLHARTHLPVVVDPSHGTGHANLVTSMAAASVAAGADGIIVEVHPDPKRAASDGAQTLDVPAFERMMDTCRRVAGAVDRRLG